MKPKRAVAALFLASAPAWAREDASPTETAADAIRDTLNEADEAIADAAEDLGRTGLRGRKAHARLDALCDDLDYAASCAVIDADGVIVSEAPAPFAGTEGRSIADQPHVRRLLDTREPVLSDLFRSVEGSDAIALQHPITGPRGRFLGAVSVMARPGSLIGHAVKPAFPDGLPEVVVGQLDGTQIFETDPEEIGRNVFTDAAYDDYPEARAVARRWVAEPEGTDEFRFLGRGLTPPVQKRVTWTTVSLHGTEWRVAVLESLEGGGPPVVRYDEPAIPIPAEVGLDSLVAIADGHLLGIAEDLELIATLPDVQSGRWDRIEGPLRRVAELNPAGTYFFAEADGSAHSIDGGAANLADRAYFQTAMEGERTIGELVVSKTTARNQAAVAVPVRGPDGEVIGMLGGSLFMDDLSAQIHDEMGLTEGLWFYAFDQDQRLALYPDPERLFLRAGELGPEVEPWFTEMQQRGEGVMRYTYEGRPRTLVFKRSPLTGWTYAFGFVGEREEAS